MKDLNIPEFESYEEEASYWDNLDTADFMPDDDQWFRFETENKRAIRVAILPELAAALMQNAHAQGVTMETLVNVLLVERMREMTSTN